MTNDELDKLLKLADVCFWYPPTRSQIAALARLIEDAAYERAAVAAEECATYDEDDPHAHCAAAIRELKGK